MSDKYITVREVADRLGVTERTVYEQLWANALPGAIRVGRAIRIPESALSSFPAYTPPQEPVAK